MRTRLRGVHVCVFVVASGDERQGSAGHAAMQRRLDSEAGRLVCECMCKCCFLVSGNHSRGLALQEHRRIALKPNQASAGDVPTLIPLLEILCSAHNPHNQHGRYV